MQSNFCFSQVQHLKRSSTFFCFMLWTIVSSFSVALTPFHWCFGKCYGHPCINDFLVNSDVLDHNGLLNLVQFWSFCHSGHTLQRLPLELQKLSFYQNTFNPQFYSTETYLDSSHFSNTTSITSDAFFIRRLFILSFFHIN